MISDYNLLQASKRYKIPLVQVFTKDRPPDKIFSDSGYIINLQDSTEGSGTHYVSVFFTHKKDPVYFDSFGQPPPKSIINWIHLLLPHKVIQYNEKEIQWIETGYCGIYDLFFISFMSKQPYNQSMDQSLRKFGNLFSNNPKDNLEILKKHAHYWTYAKD